MNKNFFDPATNLGSLVSIFTVFSIVMAIVCGPSAIENAIGANSFTGGFIVIMQWLGIALASGFAGTLLLLLIGFCYAAISDIKKNKKISIKSIISTAWK